MDIKNEISIEIKKGLETNQSLDLGTIRSTYNKNLDSFDEVIRLLEEAKIIKTNHRAIFKNVKFQSFKDLNSLLVEENFGDSKRFQITTFLIIADLILAAFGTYLTISNNKLQEKQSIQKTKIIEIEKQTKVLADKIILYESENLKLVEKLDSLESAIDKLKK